MSRTDAHRHARVELRTAATRSGCGMTTGTGRCRVETMADARQRRSRSPYARPRAYPTCRPDFVLGYTTVVSRFYGDHPDRVFARIAYHGPQRRQERDSLRTAARDWNTHGDTDIEPVHRQARHSLEWLWW